MNFRPSGRAANELRVVSLHRDFTCHAEGSVLISSGNTKVLCNVSVEESVPRFLRGKNQGWITAEYGMLPRSTGTRMAREAARGKQSGRTLEIQRLIGRSLRAAVDLSALGERTLHIDCDVIQADGGTRTAAITGAFVAVRDCVEQLLDQSKLKINPIKKHIASVSVGIYKGNPVLDLDYPEDSKADTDMNVVMDSNGDFIEIQGTAEGAPFSREHMNSLIDLAWHGIEQLIEIQNKAVS